MRQLSKKKKRSHEIFSSINYVGLHGVWATVMSDCYFRRLRHQMCDGELHDVTEGAKVGIAELIVGECVFTQIVTRANHCYNYGQTRKKT